MIDPADMIEILQKLMRVKDGAQGLATLINQGVNDEFLKKFELDPRTSWRKVEEFRKIVLQKIHSKQEGQHHSNGEEDVVNTAYEESISEDSFIGDDNTSELDSDITDGNVDIADISDWNLSESILDFFNS